MSNYQLFLDGTQLGDELIQVMSYWQHKSPTEADNSLEPVIRLTDRPLGITIYPRFRIRKTAPTQWEFEQWVFDMLTWADGGRRDLRVMIPPYTPVVDYGRCNFVSLQRPKASGPHAGRWSDQVILTFVSDTVPQFIAGS